MKTLCCCASALVVAAPASADPVDIEAGGAHVTLGTPDPESTLAVAISLGIGTKINRTFDAMLRGHVSIGDGVVSVLGPHVRQHIGTRAFIGYGPAITSVVGAGDRSMRASGIGLAADLRAGIHVADFSLTAEVLPIWVFASDSVAARSHLSYAFELGLALGYQL